MASPADRLSALRAEMASRSLDGFIVPRSDAHQGEYVAPCSERLNWLTGFSGSAGYAIVLKDQAALFVDGRYTLQAPMEVDTTLFECRHFVDQPATDWLKDHLKQGQILAFDPWLHTKPGLKKFNTVLEEIGAELKPSDENLIDRVWSDRPGAPDQPIYLHDIRFAGQSFEDKLAALAQNLTKVDQDLQVLVLPDSLAWLLNIRGNDIPHIPVALGFGLVHGDGSFDLFMDQAKIPSDVSKALKARVRFHQPDQLGAELDRMGALSKTVRLDESHCPVWISERLAQSGAKIIEAPDLCLKPKATKNKVEQDGMRTAHHYDAIAMVRFVHWLSEQPFSQELDEWQVAARLDQFRAEHPDFKDYSFPTISGAQENGAIVHYRVSPETSIPLPENGLYLVDSGAQYPTGTTDITRTLARGTPSLEMKQRFTQVLKGHIALADQKFPKGTTGSQLDVLARMHLWQAGVDFDHGTGHGVGSFLSVHEGPQRISKMASTIALEPGMVVSNEPGYYKNDGYGIRIENLVMVRKVEPAETTEREMYEFETLSLCPIDKKAIDFDLLTGREKNWLNQYHERVFRALEAELAPDVRDWLKQATQPV